jgi:hypothetical protein
MAITLVQSVGIQGTPATWSTQPTPGNLLVAVLLLRSVRAVTPPTGWTLIESVETNHTAFIDTMAMGYRFAGVSEPLVCPFDPDSAGGDGHIVLLEFSGVTALTDSSQAWGSGTAAAPGALTPTGGAPAVVIGGMACNYDLGPASTPAAGYTEVRDAALSGGFHPLGSVIYKIVSSASGTYSPDMTIPNSQWVATGAVFAGGAAPTPDPVVDIPYDPPEPAGALLEIYATEAGAARWDEATWDDDVWAASAWQDVTPQGITVGIQWGATRPELGILADTEAGAWDVAFYDPERLLDPANASSPYASDLRPGLPIRLSHRGVIIARAQADIIGHSHIDDRGSIRASDNIATLALADVPSDTELPDTLRARARAAIAAAGIAVPVEPDPPSGDPDLAPWVETEWTAWEWIAEGARQVLHMPFIDRLGTLRFRDYRAPLSRGRSFSSTELGNLLSLIQVQGQLSIVRARQTDADGGDLIERRLTPLPRWGARMHVRDDPTPDAEDWAEAVLADRSLSGLRWVPGDLIPADADSVEALATIEPLELVSIVYAEADPPVIVNGRVLGGTIRVTGKRDAAAVWRFRYETAQAPTSPLIADDTDPLAFLLTETGDGYLYPG